MNFFELSFWGFRVVFYWFEDLLVERMFKVRFGFVCFIVFFRGV